MVQFKWVKCMACEFYLTMATKKKKKKNCLQGTTLLCSMEVEGKGITERFRGVFHRRVEREMGFGVDRFTSSGIWGK